MFRVTRILLSVGLCYFVGYLQVHWCTSCCGVSSTWTLIQPQCKLSCLLTDHVDHAMLFYLHATEQNKPKAHTFNICGIGNMYLSCQHSCICCLNVFAATHLSSDYYQITTANGSVVQAYCDVEGWHYIEEREAGRGWPTSNCINWPIQSVPLALELYVFCHCHVMLWVGGWYLKLTIFSGYLI